MTISRYTLVTKGPGLTAQRHKVTLPLAFSAVSLPLLSFVYIGTQTPIRRFCCDSVVFLSVPGTTSRTGFIVHISQDKNREGQQTVLPEMYTALIRLTSTSLITDLSKRSKKWMIDSEIYMTHEKRNVNFLTFVKLQDL